jgi:PhnB protein
MKITIHLKFGGQCEAAFQHYERVLGGKVLTMLPYRDSPVAADTPAEWRGKILHAAMQVGESFLMGVDVPPSQYRSPEGFQVLLDLNEPGEAERIFQALAENGSVQMPLQKTFWATLFGVLVDRYGVPWEINCT